MTPHHTRNSPNNRHGGFALVLALMLMAFVLLLLLSVTTLVQVETRAATTSLQTLQARESARFALMLAIGELQKHAGPDQRVTARAEILGDSNFDPSARFWTGVWDTTDPTAAPTWLVSGVAVDPSNLPTKTMQLVGTGSAGSDTTQHVYAPTLEILDANGNVSDKIAWWISDEGVKASIGKLPLNLRANPNFVADTSMPALSTMLSSSQGLEDLFTDYDRFTSNDAQSLERITSIKQLIGQNDFKDNDQWNLSSENKFHAVTPYSLGVLSSVSKAAGGLMQDLSLFPKLISSEFETIIERAAAIADAKSTAATSIETLRQFVALRGLADLGTLTDGQITDPVAPILSNIMMGFTITSQELVSDNPNFVLRARFFCEFWNPFSHTLSMNSPDGDPIDLELEITGLPEVTIQRIGTDAAGNFVISNSSAPIDLQTLMSDPSSSDDAMTIRLVNDINEPWLPGRSKNWVGIETTVDPVRSPYQSIVTENKQWEDNENTLGKTGSTGQAAGIDTGEPRFPGSLRHTSPEEHTLRIKIYIKTDSDRQLLADLDGFVYEPVSTRSSGYGNKHANMTFGYHIMLREPHHSNDNIEYPRGLWLHDHDPRSPIPKFRDDWYLDNDVEENTGSPYVAVINGLSPINSPEPQRIHQTFNTENTINSDRFERLLDRSIGLNSSFNKLWQDAPLFELLRERPLSLASLQHLYFHNERPFKVGNSWGDKGTINTLSWFDRYYFSGLSRIDTPEDYDSESGLPNPTLLSYQFEDPTTAITDWQAANTDDATQSMKLAQSAVVMNRFNLNSTSVAAWKAVLGGLRINDWKYLDYPEDTSDLSTLTVSQDSRVRMFARFSQSLGETYKAPKTPAFEGSEPVAPSAYYRRGARYFDADQMEAFSLEIVRLIKEKGTPFLSMETFLSEQTKGNGSLLEQAIATVFAPSGRQKWDHQWETEGTRGPVTEMIDIDHFSPGFLTQADVMTAIGPMLSPRSDTFKIRARGESFSPQGSPTGSATIEATLQRTPEAIDSTVAMDQPTERKLKLISLRWLSDDEL